MAVAICDHYNYVRKCLCNKNAYDEEYNKQNALLIVPTGLVKTYLIKNVAKLIGVPFAKVDANVEDMVCDLVKAKDGNIEIAQYGIILIDEIDKSSTDSGPEGRYISGRDVEINLLKLMEESEVAAYIQSDMMSQLHATVRRKS